MAFFSHGSASPSNITIILRAIEIDEIDPIVDHMTDYGNISRYVLGTRFRKAKLTLMVTTKTEKDNFFAFYRSATNAGSRFTFIADTTNEPSDTWSAFFVSAPQFQRRLHPGVLGDIEVEIQDAAVSL